MHCECCDKPMSDKEATAKFVNEDKDAPIRYVGMCTKCQGFLPDNVRVINRFDLEDELGDTDIPLFDQQDEDNYGYEN